MPQSVISGATTVRRARSVAEMSGHGGSPGGPGHHGSLGGHGQGGGQVQNLFAIFETFLWSIAIFEQFLLFLSG